MSIKRFRSGLAAVALLCVGCSASQPLPLSPPIAVKGKILYRGKPLTQGKITLEPTDGGHSAKGEIQSDGGFTLTTFKEGDGALPGVHRVLLSGTDRPVQAKNEPHTKVVDGQTDLLIDIK